MLPLFFQVVLLDSPSQAGARLVIPSLAAPIGGLISGIIMSRWGYLAYLVRSGSLLMFVGNLLVMLLRFDDSPWKYFAYVIPASLGQGIVYPGILFTFLAAFGHAGLWRHPRLSLEKPSPTNPLRPCGFGIHRLLNPLPRHRLGRCNHVGDRAEYIEIRLARGTAWDTR